MERRVNDLRECCSSVLSRKLPGVGAEIGTAAAASRALDTVLTNMTRAFKMEAASGLTSDMQDQLGHWKKRECELEQKHCAALQEHTHKLRIAAALQVELFAYQGSEKADEVIGLRSDAEYRRDLVRLRRLRKEQQRQIEDLRSEVHRLKLKPTISGRDILPPLASSEVTSLPDTPPNTKLIAAALARSLKEVGIGRHSNPRSDSALLDSIASIVPSLISGKINTSEAMEEIFKSFSPRSSAQAMRRPRQTIVDILGQITKQSVELGAGSATEAIGQCESAVCSSSLSSPTSALENAFRALCSASIRANNTNDIDSAVAALLEQDPKVIRHRIDIEEVTRTLLESFENDYDESCIKELVTAVAECLAAQSTAPAEAAEVAQECFQEIKDLGLKESNSKNAESLQSRKSKSVSLVEDSDVSSVSSGVQIRATVSNKNTIDKKKSGDDVAKSE